MPSFRVHVQRYQTHSVRAEKARLERDLAASRNRYPRKIKATDDRTCRHFPTRQQADDYVATIRASEPDSSQVTVTITEEGTPGSTEQMPLFTDLPHTPKPRRL